MRPSTSKTTVQLLMALELPESTSQDDRLTFKTSTVELWNILNSLASFDIISIDQQYRRVANSLTRIAYVLNKLKLVSTLPWNSVFILSYGLIIQALCRPMFWQPCSAFWAPWYSLSPVSAVHSSLERTTGMIQALLRQRTRVVVRLQ